MSLRTGIHADSRLKDNCLEYSAFPVGFANADYEGNLGNPFLNGIKTPKYQRSAPKPVSADVMAVTNAKFMPGDNFSNARNILQQYQKEVREWKPPPVKLMSAVEVWNSLHDSQPDQESGEESGEEVTSFLPRLAIASRGAQIIRGTIGTENENPEITRYLDMYRVAPNKREISSRLYSALQDRNLTTASEAMPMNEMLRVAFTIGTNVNVDNIFAPQTADVAPSPVASPIGSPSISYTSPVASPIHLRTRGIQDRRGIQEPRARRRPGIPEPTTTPLTPEIE